MNKKDTILIVYPGGAYGTFLEWCLSYFSGMLDDESMPFNFDTGSCHEFEGHPLDFPNTISSEEYFSSDLIYPVARSHGNTNFSVHIKDYVERYKDYAGYVINIVPDDQCRLLTFHNAIHKIKDLEYFTKNIENLCELSAADTHWERREKISFKIKYFQNYSWYYGTGPNQLTITVYDIVYNLKNCLTSIFDKTKLSFDANRINKFDVIEQQWLGLQKFKHLDQLCHSIAKATATDNDLDWSDKNLSVYDEAYVQMLLRDLHKFDLKCYNLNEFPTNSHDLRKLLINVKPI